MYKMNFAHLFSMQPPRGHVTLHDVKDAYHLAQQVRCPKKKEALYAIHGLDMHRVEEYYPIVARLEKSWVKPTHGTIHVGPWKIQVRVEKD